MKRPVFASIVCIGAVLLTGIYLQPRQTAKEGTVRVIPGGLGPSDFTFPPAPALVRSSPAGDAPVPRLDFALLATEAPGESDRGAAIVRFSSGSVQHVAVNDWVDHDYRLIAVGDTDATLTDGIHKITLVIEPSPPIVADPAGGLPGIDFNQPGKANPAIARR